MKYAIFFFVAIIFSILHLELVSAQEDERVSNGKREVVRLESSKILHALSKTSPYNCRRRKCRRRKSSTPKQKNCGRTTIPTPIPIDPRITIGLPIPPELSANIPK